MGEFCLEWKTAEVRPLLKNPAIEHLHKNYRLVSKLCFLSKLVKMYAEATNAKLQKIQYTTRFSICILKKLFNRDQPYKDS